MVFSHLFTYKCDDEKSVEILYRKGDVLKELSKYEEILEFSKNKKIFSHPIVIEDRPHPINGFWIACREVSNNPIFQNTVHFHDYFELELMCDGSAEHIFNGKTFQVSKGSMLLLRKNDFHTYHFLGDGKARFFTVNFMENSVSPQILNKILRYNGVMALDLEEKEFSEMFSLLGMLEREFQNPDEDFPIIQRSLFDYILIRFLKMLPIEDEQKRDMEKNYTIEKFLSFVDNNFLDPMLSLSDVSSHLKITPNYLGQLIKKNLGMSFNQYLKQRRLDYSLRLLTQRMLSVTEIAEKSGFSSCAYFISQFKKFYGITPKQFITDDKEK